MDEADARVLERIRMLRLEKGLSIQELENRSGVPRSSIFYFESKRKVPTLTTLHKLAKAFGVSPREFFD